MLRSRVSQHQPQLTFVHRVYVLDTPVVPVHVNTLKTAEFVDSEPIGLIFLAQVQVITVDSH